VDGLADVIKHYELDMEVTQLVNLVSKALVYDVKPAVPEAVEKAPAAGSLAGYSILLADDEPDILTFFNTVLEDNGAKVTMAVNGDEALAQVREHKPDLICLDLSMPGKDGGEVFETLREDPELQDTKVLVITGKPELRRLIYERSVLPPEGYLDKPVDEETLVLNIRKILELTQEAT